MADLIGQSLGRYRILERLGEGGMAFVYKAYDTLLERDVAIKIIRRGAFPPDQLGHILKRFEREAKALAKLSHPNIVSVLDYGEYQGSPYLVMVYLPGGTLKRHLGKPIPWQQAARILLPVSEALEYAHEHNIIHRDIKPSNILLTEKGQPMLTDFGIAKILEAEETTSLTGSGLGVGTPEYMAPEQWTGEISPKSDIYSLGVVFYEMVTGRKPYSADTPAGILLKQANEPLPRPTLYVPNLPVEIEKILLRALAKKPGDRFRSISEFATALNAVGAASGRKAARSAATRAPKPEITTDASVTFDKISDSSPRVSIRQKQTAPVKPVPAAPRRAKRENLWIVLAGIILLAIVVACGGFALAWKLFNPGSASAGPSETARVVHVVITSTSPAQVIDTPPAQIDILSLVATQTDPAPIEPTATHAAATWYVYINKEPAFLYTGPGRGFSLVSWATYGKGAKFSVLTQDRTGKWLFCISPDDVQGWLPLDMATVEFDLSVIPTASYIPPVPTIMPTWKPRRSH